MNAETAGFEILAQSLEPAADHKEKMRARANNERKAESVEADRVLYIYCPLFSNMLKLKYLKCVCVHVKTPLYVIGLTKFLGLE